MDPIVHGITERYKNCLRSERTNFHQWSDWHEIVYPVASPEFALLDADHHVLYRWFGVVEADEFMEVLEPLCNG